MMTFLSRVSQGGMRRRRIGGPTQAVKGPPISSSSSTATTRMSEVPSRGTRHTIQQPKDEMHDHDSCAGPAKADIWNGEDDYPGPIPIQRHLPPAAPVYHPCVQWGRHSRVGHQAIIPQTKDQRHLKAGQPPSLR